MNSWLKRAASAVLVVTPWHPALGFTLEDESVAMLGPNQIVLKTVSAIRVPISIRVYREEPDAEARTRLSQMQLVPTVSGGEVNAQAFAGLVGLQPDCARALNGLNTKSLGEHEGGYLNYEVVLYVDKDRESCQEIDVNGINSPGDGLVFKLEMGNLSTDYYEQANAEPTVNSTGTRNFYINQSAEVIANTSE